MEVGRRMIKPRSSIFILTIIIFCIFGFISKVQAGWLSGYSYRKSVTLSRPSGAVTNYQMKLKVGESSGASDYDVHCNGHVLSNFNDLRFTTSNGTTLLNYWIESISGTTPNQTATIWIKFDSIGTSATKFYMYYGNSGASAYSNISNTFLFGDDFESWFPQLVSTDGAGGPLVQNSSGDIFCIYQKPSIGSIVQRKSTDGGLTWSSETTVVSAGVYGWPHVHAIGNTFFLSYTHVNGSVWDVKFRKSTDGGNSWGSEIAVVSSRFADSDILALDANTILLATINSAQTGIDVYRSTDSGSTWSLHSSPLSGASNKQEDVFLFKLSNGNILIAWEEEVAELGKSYIKSKISTDNGATWGSVITIWNSEDAAYDYEGGGFFYDNLGNLISVAYTNVDGVLSNCQYENYKLKYKQSTDNGSTWSAASDLVPDARGLGPENFFLKLANNYVLFSHGAYWMGSSPNLYVSRIYHDLTYSDIPVASDRWTTGNGKVFIQWEGSNKIARVEGYVTGDATYRAHIISAYTGSDYAIRTRVKGGTTNLRFDFRYTDVNNHYIFNLAATEAAVYKDVGGVYTSINSVAFTTQANVWYVLDLLLLGNSIKSYVDGVLKNDFTDSTYSSGYAGLGSGNDLSTNGPVFFDYFLVRKYVSPEPTWGTWGSEEIEIGGKITFGSGGSLTLGSGGSITE